MIPTQTFNVPPTDVIKKIKSLRNQMIAYSQDNIPVPIAGDTLEIVQAAMELKDSFKELPKPNPIFGLSQSATEEYLLGALIMCPDLPSILTEVITYAEVSDAMFAGKEIKVEVSIPAGNIFEEASWFGNYIDLPQTRKNLEEVIVNSLDDELIPLWDDFITVKVTDAPGKGDTCQLNTPVGYDYFDQYLLPVIEDALNKALSEDKLPEIVEEKPESQWWRREPQVYVDEEIVNEKDGITYISTILSDDFDPELYDDCLSPAAKKAFYDGDWGFVGVGTVAFDEDGIQLCDPETTWGIENLRATADDLIKEQISVLKSRLSKPKYDDGYRQLKLQMA